MSIYVVAGLIVAAVAILAVYSRRKVEIVYEWDHALLYRDGRFQRVLPAGRHVFWSDPKRRSIHTLPSHDQIQYGQPVDVSSAEKFVFRLGYSLVYRVTDPRWALESQYPQQLTLLAGQALTELAGERTVQQILDDRTGLAESLKARLASELPGLEIGRAAVGPVTLPPELRRMFTEVERAKMEGQAGLERARSEQASLRSLANAARLLKGNPELMRLRLLQAVSPTGKGATLVLGQDAIGLAGAAPADAKPPRRRAKADA